MKKLKEKVEQFLTDLGHMPLTGRLAIRTARFTVGWNKAADTATITGITS